MMIGTAMPAARTFLISSGIRLITEHEGRYASPLMASGPLLVRPGAVGGALWRLPFQLRHDAPARHRYPGLKQVCPTWIAPLPLGSSLAPATSHSHLEAVALVLYAIAYEAVSLACDCKTHASYSHFYSHFQSLTDAGYT
jgi:hypothetical protein